MKKDWYKEPLAMPVGEIVQDYCMGKNKKEMLTILADRNGTKPCRIAWILDRCGVGVDGKRLPRAVRTEGAEDPRDYWARLPEAIECDMIRERREALEAERESAKRKAAQSMPEFDEPEPMEEECTETAEVMEDMMMDTAEEMQTMDTVEPADRRRAILTDASLCVCIDRNVQYGEPEDNFDVIAGMWSAYLGVPVTAGAVADMMILFKVGRNATAERASRDTYVDIAGYAACGGGMLG
jgi:hypothetical protein